MATLTLDDGTQHQVTLDTESADVVLDVLIIARASTIETLGAEETIIIGGTHNISPTTQAGLITQALPTVILDQG